MKDYYKILGVEPEATSDDIKKAFRKLSMKYHPDKNNGDDTMFKEINEANSILSDEDKRRDYDRLRRGGGGKFFTTGGFNGYSWFNGPQKPTNVNIKISITIEEAYKGCKKNVNANGKVYSVDIPKGTTSGKILKLAGLGGAGFDMSGNYVRGDILVFIEVQNSEKYYLDKDGTIEMMVAVDWLDAILGTTMDIKLFDKKISIKVPKYTQNGGFIIVAKQGFPKFKSDECGNIKVNFIVKMPKRLNSKQTELLKKVREEK